MAIIAKRGVEGKVLYNMLSGRNDGLKDCVGQVLSITGYVITRDDEADVKKLVVLTDDGRMLGTSSRTAIKDWEVMVEVMETLPITGVEVKSYQGNSGRSYLKLEFAEI